MDLNVDKAAEDFQDSNEMVKILASEDLFFDMGPQSFDPKSP